MHPRTEELLGYLEKCGTALDLAFAAVPEVDRTRRASETSWTPAEVVQHVGLLEVQMVEVMRRRFAAALAKGDLPPDPETSSILNCLSEPLIRNRKFKVVAPVPVSPASGVDAATAVALWRRAHDGFLDFVRQSDGAALARLSAPHPILGVLDFYQWIVFVGAHELRHADQIQEIAAAVRA